MRRWGAVKGTYRSLVNRDSGLNATQRTVYNEHHPSGSGMNSLTIDRVTVFSPINDLCRR